MRSASTTLGKEPDGAAATSTFQNVGQNLAVQRITAGISCCSRPPVFKFHFLSDVRDSAAPRAKRHRPRVLQASLTAMTKYSTIQQAFGFSQQSCHLVLRH